jgi:phosphotransferase system  glucose/maltose/N-acetylglucosamine-specific IIC component
MVMPYEAINMKRTTHASIVIIKVVSAMLFLYGLLGWIYGVLIQLIYPYLLPFGLSHLIPWIRVDTFAVISFALSALGFLIWRITGELTKPPTR